MSLFEVLDGRVEFLEVTMIRLLEGKPIKFRAASTFF